MPRLTIALAAFALAFVACAGEDVPLAGNSEIVSDIPWTAPETARFQVMQGDDIIGSGELVIDTRGDVLVLNQFFEFPEEGISDRVAVETDPATLRPAVTRRVIDGPEGRRECTASYAETRVSVLQQAGADERTDEIDVPARFYDTWADLFLWRTLDFQENLELSYTDVLSCSLAKPDLLDIKLKVIKMEMVEVPAGSFQAWRLEIRSGGDTQRAWYAADEARALVRYDNGDLVFELESIE